MQGGGSEMDLFFNECSLHGQFPDIQAFEHSLDAVMEMRQIAKKYSRDLLCHRNCQLAAVTHQLLLPQAIQLIDKNKARVLMAWFCQTGPYWEDVRQHSNEEYFAYLDNVVTDTAVGECAYLRFIGKQAQIASMVPSDWRCSDLEVVWHRGDGSCIAETLLNHVGPDTLEKVLQEALPPIQSWRQMEELCRRRFIDLQFSEDTFKPLKGRPFVLAAANSIVDLMDVLSRFKSSHQASGGRTPEGNELYQTYFTGQLAWFTDSSTQEKAEFKSKMTFSHPDVKDETIFAPFHGKVQTPQIRIHFSWPVRAATPLYVLYVGDKITKY